MHPGSLQRASFTIVGETCRTESRGLDTVRLCTRETARCKLSDTGDHSCRPLRARPVASASWHAQRRARTDPDSRPLRLSSKPTRKETKQLQFRACRSALRDGGTRIEPVLPICFATALQALRRAG